MDFGSGGYVLVRLPETIVIEGIATDVTIDVGSEIVSKLSQTEKPVLFTHFTVLFAGESIGTIGYSNRTTSPDGHLHTLGVIQVSTVSETQIKVALVF